MLSHAYLALDLLFSFTILCPINLYKISPTFAPQSSALPTYLNFSPSPKKKKKKPPINPIHPQKPCLHQNGTFLPSPLSLFQSISNLTHPSENQNAQPQRHLRASARIQRLTTTTQPRSSTAPIRTGAGIHTSTQCREARAHVRSALYRTARSRPCGGCVHARVRF